MKSKYRATFVIPSNAQRMLGDAGWEFSSQDRIPDSVVKFLMAKLALEKSDEYLDMEEFSGENAKATLLFDENHSVEHVYFRGYGDRDIHGELLAALALSPFKDIVEVFSP